MQMHHDGKCCGTGKRVPIRVTKVCNDWKWCLLPRNEGLKCGNRCSPRSFDQNKKSFTEAEEDLIIKLHSLLGNRWALIAGRLPDRTENEVKAYWNSKLRAKQLKKGNMHSKKREIETSFSMTRTLDPLQVTDATSGIEEDSGEARGLNLNLSISMTMSSNSSLLDAKEKVQANTVAHSPSIDAGNIGRRTLLLFQ